MLAVVVCNKLFCLQENIFASLDMSHKSTQKDILGVLIESVFITKFYY